MGLVDMIFDTLMKRAKNISKLDIEAMAWQQIGHPDGLTDT